MRDFVAHQQNWDFINQQIPYYSLTQVKNQDYKGSDVFIVLGFPKGERLSWVGWEEGKNPDVVIELLSSKGDYTNQYRSIPKDNWSVRY